MGTLAHRILEAPSGIRPGHLTSFRLMATPKARLLSLVGYGWGIAVACIGGGLLIRDDYAFAALFIGTGVLLCVWGRWRGKQPD